MESNREKFGKTLGVVASLFQGHQVTPEWIETWFRLFGAEDPRVFSAALKASIMEPGRRFFPAPGEIVERINALKEPAGLTASQAWAAVLKLRDETGKYHPRAGHYWPPGATKALSDRAQRAVEQVGWDRICDTGRDKIGWLRGEFIRAYEQEQKQEQIDAVRTEVKQLPEGKNDRKSID